MGRHGALSQQLDNHATKIPEVAVDQIRGSEGRKTRRQILLKEREIAATHFSGSETEYSQSEGEGIGAVIVIVTVSDVVPEFSRLER